MAWPGSSPFLGKLQPTPNGQHATILAQLKGVIHVSDPDPHLLTNILPLGGLVVVSRHHTTFSFWYLCEIQRTSCALAVPHRSSSGAGWRAWGGLSAADWTPGGRLLPVSGWHLVSMCGQQPWTWCLHCELLFAIGAYHLGENNHN